MIIDSHENFLKIHSNGFFERLKKEGYLGDENMVYTHFLEAVVKLDGFVDMKPLKKMFKGTRLEQEYFNILILVMNEILLEHKNDGRLYLETPIGNIPFSEEENDFYNNLSDVELMELYLKGEKSGFIPPKPFQVMKNRGLIFKGEFREDIEKRLEEFKKKELKK